MYDVAVIGTGITGVEAVTQLAQIGYEVLMVEKGKTQKEEGAERRMSTIIRKVFVQFLQPTAHRK